MVVLCAYMPFEMVLQDAVLKRDVLAPSNEIVDEGEARQMSVPTYCDEFHQQSISQCASITLMVPEVCLPSFPLTYRSS